MGWIGECEKIYAALTEAGADQTDDGKAFLLYRSMPISYLGLGQECVVDDECEYSIDGDCYKLADLMNRYAPNPVTVI